MKPARACPRLCSAIPARAPTPAAFAGRDGGDRGGAPVPARGLHRPVVVPAVRAGGVDRRRPGRPGPRRLRHHLRLGRRLVGDARHPVQPGQRHLRGDLPVGRLRHGCRRRLVPCRATAGGGGQRPPAFDPRHRARRGGGHRPRTA
ncbi:hypothetical protein ACRAWD_17935 [Caulobacter segnis]